MIITVTINNNINMIVTSSITINISRNSGCSFHSMHIAHVCFAGVGVQGEKLVGQGRRQFECGDAATANTHLQLPSPIISSSLLATLCFCDFADFFYKKIALNEFFFFKYYETFFKNWYLTIKAREWTSLSVVYKKSESLCDSCVALTSPRFMVFSRIDNIKYFPHWQSKIRSSRGTGLSNQAAIHKSSSGLWSR